MEELVKNRVLVIVALILCVGVVLLGVIDAPDLKPVGVIYTEPADRKGPGGGETADAAPAEGETAPPETAPGDAAASRASDAPPAGPGATTTRGPASGAPATPPRSTAKPSATPAKTSRPTAAPTAAPVGKVNLNTATAAELMTLKGVGEVIAGRIIEYRETHAGFDSIEELMQVKGIGEKTFEKLREFITV